jgi:hypothetical protein
LPIEERNPKILDTSVIFQENVHSKQFPKREKIRPIWSPWSRPFCFAVVAMEIINKYLPTNREKMDANYLPGVNVKIFLFRRKI